MTKEELEKATGQELIDARNYCGVDGYYCDYLDNVNTEILKRLNRLAELEAQIEKMKQCGNCGNGTIGNCEHCKRKPNQKSTDTVDYWRLKEIKEK